MLDRKTRIKRSYTKTVLIIIGVIIAFLMTMSSPLFTADSGLSVDADQTNPVAEVQKDGSSSPRPNYNSGTRLLHIFTRNLPYLNNK